MKLRTSVFLVSSVLLPATIVVLAFAAATDEQKCLASKLKAVGKYEACLFKSYALQTIKGLPSPDFTKCSGKFSLDWSKTESKYGGACPTSGDAVAVAGLADNHAAEMFDLLNGVEPVCGNNTIEPGEACDGTDLGSADCVSEGYLGGTLACGVTCQLDETACFHCEPQNCTQAGATCGPAGDGCGDSQTCGDCTPPQLCGGGGTASQCGGNCTPKTCSQIGADCGVSADGCGGTTDSCGTCPVGLICTGIPASCLIGSSCSPLSVAAACGSRNCGLADNGCGSVLSCGTCASGEGCVLATGTCASVGACIPRTCGGLAASGGTTACNEMVPPMSGCFCGAVADGCGGLLDCGSCNADENCGSGGPNVCD